MDDAGDIDRNSEEHAQGDPGNRDPGLDRAVGQPLGIPTFQQCVGEDTLQHLHRQKHYDPEGDDPDAGVFGLLDVELDVGEYVLQGLDVALEDIDVRVASVDRGVELVLSKADLGLDRREPTSLPGSEISPIAAPDLDTGKGFQNDEGERPVPDAAHAVPHRPQHRGGRIEGPCEARLAADTLELPFIVVRIRSGEARGQGAGVLGFGGRCVIGRRCCRTIQGDPTPR